MTPDQPLPDGQIAISSIIGFGFCPPGEVEVLRDGAEALTYRYLPPGMWQSSWRHIIAALNAAGDPNQPMEPSPTQLEPTEALTRAGRQFFRRQPKYGIMRVKYPWFQWTQFMPGGGEAQTLRANQLQPFLDEIVSIFPMNRWAQEFFEPWKDWLPTHPEFGPMAMGMAPPITGPLPELSPESVASEEPGWAREGGDRPRASIEERIDSVWGLWKVFLVSPPWEHLKYWGEQPATETRQFLEGAVGVITTDTDTFKWSPHQFLRWELPAVLLCPMLRWAEIEDNRHPGEWAALDIVPSYAWDMPKVAIEDLPDGGRRVAILLFKPLDSYDLSFIAGLEADVRQHLR